MRRLIGVDCKHRVLFYFFDAEILFLWLLKGIGVWRVPPGDGSSRCGSYEAHRAIENGLQGLSGNSCTAVELCVLSRFVCTTGGVPTAPIHGRPLLWRALIGRFSPANYHTLYQLPDTGCICIVYYYE